jgi:hypothetical protein
MKWWFFSGELNFLHDNEKMGSILRLVQFPRWKQISCEEHWAALLTRTLNQKLTNTYQLIREKHILYEQNMNKIQRPRDNLPKEGCRCWKTYYFHQITCTFGSTCMHIRKHMHTHYSHTHTKWEASLIIHSLCLGSFLKKRLFTKQGMNKLAASRAFQP